MTGGSARGAVAVIGVGESDYYRRGQAPSSSFELLLDAILSATADAGIDATSIDGFVSFSNDPHRATRLANALRVEELRWSTMQSEGGGAGGSGAIQQAAAAIFSGFAERVVVYRSLTQGNGQRFGRGARRPDDSHRAPYGMMSAATYFAVRASRFFHETGVSPAAQRAVSMASYHHAQQNARALMYGRPLSEATYEQSRWIAEPLRLFDCCQESDGAAAVILTSAAAAKDLHATPVYLLGAAQGADRRGGGFGAGVHDMDSFATAEFRAVARRLYQLADLRPDDVDVVQCYENFSAGVVMALLEHGLCDLDEANSFFTLENLIAPTGRLPLNTSGGNLAESYVHGMQLHVEAVRQLREQSTNQVPDAKVSLVISSPMIAPATNAIYGTGETL